MTDDARAAWFVAVSCPGGWWHMLAGFHEDDLQLARWYAERTPGGVVFRGGFEQSDDRRDEEVRHLREP